ncbi:hypothetical protein B0H19DRAFT_1142001, partial [Mycena capillaripes]
MSHFPPHRFPFGSPLFCLALAQLCHPIPSLGSTCAINDELHYLPRHLDSFPTSKPVPSD